MSYFPGDIYYKQFTTNNISGISQNADSLPWGVLNRNGADDTAASATVFINNIDVGRYNVSGVIPSTYNVGDSVNLNVSGVINGNIAKAIFDLGILDKHINSVNTISVTGTAPSNFIVPQSVAPGVTVSVTGTISSVGQVNNPVSVNNLSPGLTVSITGTAPANFLAKTSVQPGVTVSVTGTAPNNFISPKSVQPGVSVSVTGTMPSVNISSINPGLTIGVTGTAPANFIAPNSVQAGVTVSVTGSLPPVTVNTFSPGLTVSVTGTAPNDFISPGSMQPGVSVSVTGTLPSVNVSSIDPGLTISVTGANQWTVTEMKQLRYKIGIDGASSAPTNKYNGHLELSISGLQNVVVENGINMQQWMSLLGAVVAGSSTVTGNDVVYYAAGNSDIERVSATAVSGARQAIVLFLP